ncbi:MAG: UvrD-helicase domain-containing protein [Erysipelotrichaceae bacterium]
MSYLDQLNKNQMEAVTQTQSHVRIIAGAGSGKTRVITTRIAYLVNEMHVYPNKILAITFTNKAANEMKERVKSLLGDDSARIQISTIHSFCVRLLREDIHELGYPHNFTILDSDDQKSILRDAYKELEVDIKEISYHNSLSYISNNKTQLIDPEKAKGYAGDFNGEQLKADIYEYYERRLHQMMALDFDDLLINTYKILKGYQSIRDKWQRRFTYLHVDEFQDVDKLQYSIIKNLVGVHSYLCVVGDPDQTIYTWRGAQVDIIMNFEKDFKDVKTIILNENYRSTPSILKGANSLIKNNKNRVDKDLFTTNEDSGKIIHFSAMDETNEPLWISARIRALHAAGDKYREIAILYRSNYLSRALEKAMLEANIPYKIYGGIRFYDRAEIKDSLSYLRLLLVDNPASDLAIKRIINMPKRGIGAKTLGSIEMISQTENKQMYEVLKEHQFSKGKAQNAINEFVAVIERARSLLKEVSIAHLLEQVLYESGYMKALQEDHEETRIENIKELIHDIVIFEDNNPEGTLDDYLQMISLYTDKEMIEEGDYIQLMTIHAAKGLEFDNVFVYSLSEGIFPNEKSIGEGGAAALEEERRLAYVAFTRARKRLYLSDSQGYSFILNNVRKTSRFIMEIDPQYLEDVGLAMKPNRFSFGYQPLPPMSNEFDMIQHRPGDENVGAIEKTPPKKKMGPIHKGDLLTHSVFGDGVVISIRDGLAQIAFDKRFGIRNIQADHASLTKK